MVGIEFEEGVCDRGVGGAPDLPRRKFLRRSAMSGGALMPPLLEKVGCGTGLRAALTEPSGVDEAVMPAVVVASCEVREGSRGGCTVVAAGVAADMLACCEASVEDAVSLEREEEDEVGGVGLLSALMPFSFARVVSRDGSLITAAAGTARIWG